MKNKLKKLLAATAIVSVFGAAAAFIVTKFKKNSQQNNGNSEEDDLDTLDFESIQNDTPREYVSISINERKPETADDAAVND